MLWQADLYRRPLKSDTGEPLWELLLCSEDLEFTYGATCPQKQVSGDWVQQQLQTALAKAPVHPQQVQVFRPQSLRLLEAGSPPGLAVVPCRDTPAIKRWLVQRAAWYPNLENYSGEAYDPLGLDKPPPVPLAESLWGEQWRFAAINAGAFEQIFPYEPIPVRSLPEQRLPSRLGLASTVQIPGIIIDAGRKSMPLAQWLQSSQPAWLSYVPGAPDGLILEAGLVDRWVLTTFDDPDVAAAGRSFEQRKQVSKGLHFLLVRPDDSGMTQTGLWLLQSPLPQLPGNGQQSGSRGPGGIA